MSDLIPHDQPVLARSSAQVLSDLRQLIGDARQRVAQAVNGALTLTYWRIGKRLLAENLTEGRGEYGRQILASLSQELVAEFGKGFSYSSLTRMVRFAELFPDEPIVASLIQQLTWTHILALLPVKDPLAREFYAEMCRAMTTARELAANEPHPSRGLENSSEPAASAVPLTEARK
jgi:hypothetical protein